MKKLFFTLCALCLCGTMWGQTYQDETTGLYYTLDGENATIVEPIDGSVYSNDNLVSYESIEGAYTIPEKVGEYPVVAVGESAFNGATISGTFVLPSYINTVGAGAFGSCTSLSTVIIEYSATPLVDQNTTASTQMFNGCRVTKVEMYRDFTINYGSGVVGGAFAYYDYLQEIVIGEYVTSIPIYMFRGHYGATATLTTVTCYAENPPELQTGAISNFSSTPILYTPYDYLNNYRLDADWVSVFGSENMHALGNNGDPDWPTDESAFQDENGLWYDPIEDTDFECVLIADQGGEVYEGTITIPETVVSSIDGNTYTVTRIDEGAFLNSNISGAVVIPANILYMGKNAFENCTGITSVTYEYSPYALNEENTDNMTGGSFSGCSGITTVNQYRNVTWTGNNQSGPFVGHTALTTINIGPRVTQIGNWMYRQSTADYSQLSTINCYAIEPPTLGSAPFDNLVTGYVINVPQGTLSDYQTSWSGYTLAEMSDAFAITTHDNNDGTAYATFYNGASDVELFDGELTAYYAYQLDTEEDGDLCIDIASIGSTIPASTGVIVETEKEGTYLAIATGEKTEFSETNDLYGYDSAQTIADPSGSYYYYLLSSSGGQVGFYFGAEGGAAFTCQAHRAYLALEQGVVDEATANGSLGISIRKGSGEDTTGISSVESANEGASVKGIYTIQGVRVSNMNQPGLYIVDGKKVLVK